MSADKYKDVQFLRLGAVLEKTGMKKTKLYDMINKGEFPKPIKIGGTSVWPDTKVCEWQAEKMGEHA